MQKKYSKFRPVKKKEIAHPSRATIRFPWPTCLEKLPTLLADFQFGILHKLQQ